MADYLNCLPYVSFPKDSRVPPDSNRLSKIHHTIKSQLDGNRFAVLSFWFRYKKTWKKPAVQHALPSILVSVCDSPFRCSIPASTPTFGNFEAINSTKHLHSHC